MFTFTFQDGSQPDERWTVYDPAVFALESPPSKSVLPSKIDVLRHQAFDEPLPFGDSLTVFEHRVVEEILGGRVTASEPPTRRSRLGFRSSR